MKLSIGIIGLPNAGKSTLFQALTKKRVTIASYPFSTVDPNIATVAAKDERLTKVAQVFNSKKILPASIEFVDIAGLVSGAHTGLGLGNQFLAQIREVDAVLHIVRTFEDENVPHVENSINPERDFQIVIDELEKKDAESKEKINLLALKPQLIILNGPYQKLNITKPYIAVDTFAASKSRPSRHEQKAPLSINLLEIDLKNEMSENEVQEIFSQIKNLLNLITFFTANENEARSWFVKFGTEAPRAAGAIHNDFEEKFIKAEVINWEKLVEAASWATARQKGWIKLEGKDYIVQDGDVMLVRHS